VGPSEKIPLIPLIPRESRSPENHRVAEDRSNNTGRPMTTYPQQGLGLSVAEVVVKGHAYGDQAAEQRH
jgi:hypothetical protein